MNMTKLRYGLLAGLTATALIALSTAGSGQQAAASPTSPADPVAVAEFHDATRKLWEDHVTWTRLYIVSALAGLPDRDAAAARLLRNQDDIGNAIKSFYGDAAGNQLSALLRDHILIAAEALEAAKAGDTGRFERARASWDANADDIAAFLSAANPRAWPLDTVKPMMREHLDLTLASAVARLNGDWPADVAAYDRIHDHILGLADALSAGIVDQFPDRFRIGHGALDRDPGHNDHHD